jgi:hypothetical protein
VGVNRVGYYPTLDWKSRVLHPSVIKKEMRKIGMKGASLVDFYNAKKSLVRLLRKLEEIGKIRPYKTLDLYSRTIEFPDYLSRECVLVDWYRLNNVERSAAERALSSESNIYDEREDYRYCFLDLTVDEMPPSFWEQYYYEDDWEMKDVAYHIYKIYRLERSILHEGIHDGELIILKVLFADYGDMIAIDGGNHRVQAIRNLVHYKDIPASTTIPCMVYWSPW